MLSLQSSPEVEGASALDSKPMAGLFLKRSGFQKVPAPESTQEDSPSVQPVNLNMAATCSCQTTNCKHHDLYKDQRADPNSYCQLNNSSAMPPTGGPMATARTSPME